jgi:hypothetical protein
LIAPPFALLSYAVGRNVLPRTRQPDAEGRIDVLGLVLAIGAMVCHARHLGRPTVGLGQHENHRHVRRRRALRGGVRAAMSPASGAGIASAVVPGALVLGRQPRGGHLWRCQRVDPVRQRVLPHADLALQPERSRLRDDPRTDRRVIRRAVRRARRLEVRRTRAWRCRARSYSGSAS